MSVATVENPRKLTKEALILLGGGAVSGLVASALQLVAGSANPALGALAFGGVVGLLVNLTDPKTGTPMLRLVLSMLAGIVMAALLSVHWSLAAAAGGILFGAAFSLEDGDSTVERGVFAAIYGLALVGGMYVTNVLGSFIDIALVANIFGASTWGLFLAFAGGLKRVKWSRDELASEFNDAYAEVKGDERETIRTGRILYDQIVKELDRSRDDSHRERAIEIANETSRALIALTRRAQQLRDGAERTSHRGLQSRIVALDERIQASKDATVRRELEATLEQLVEQVKVRRRFDVARARLEARQQRCFTALERLHVSLVQSGSGADDAAVLESIESLEKLSDEIRWRNLSVDELVADTDGDAVEEPDTDDIIAELRAEMDSEAAEADAEEVVLDSAAPQAAEDRTVLDTSGSSDDGDADEPPGTDGSVEVSDEQAAHVQSDSR